MALIGQIYIYDIQKVGERYMIYDIHFMMVGYMVGYMIWNIHVIWYMIR